MASSALPSAAERKQKKRRGINSSPDAEIVALSPKTLLATDRFSCDVCGKGFPRQQNLQLHRRRHNLPGKLKQKTSHEIRKKVFICPEMGCVHHDPSRALGDITGIKKHFSRKYCEKKFSCHKCNKKRESFTYHRSMCDAACIFANANNPGSMYLGPAADSQIPGSHQLLLTRRLEQGASNLNSFTSFLSGQSIGSAFNSYGRALGDRMSSVGVYGGGRTLEEMYKNWNVGGGSYGSGGGYGGGMEPLIDQMNAPRGGMMSDVKNAGGMLVGPEVNNNVLGDPQMNVESEYGNRLTRDFLGLGTGMNSVSGGGMGGDDHSGNGTTNSWDREATTSADARPFIHHRSPGFSSHPCFRFKERLVAKGYNQKWGIDLEEPFSTVVKMTIVRKTNDSITIVAIYVDDIVLTSNDAQGLTLTQSKFTQELLKEANITDFKTEATPLPLNLKLSADKGELYTDPSYYRMFVGHEVNNNVLGDPQMNVGNLGLGTGMKSVSGGGGGMMITVFFGGDFLFDGGDFMFDGGDFLVVAGGGGGQKWWLPVVGGGGGCGSEDGDEEDVEHGEEDVEHGEDEESGAKRNSGPDAEVVELSPQSLMATNRFWCEVCNRGFQREQNLQLHRRGHNLPGKLKKKTNDEVKKRVYICPEVGCVHHDPSRALGDLTAIKNHFSRKHSGEKIWL
ncbi:hypothetical protein AgCh_002423 [Apium graveolens]